MGKEQQGMEVTFIAFKMVIDGRESIAEFHTRVKIDDLMNDSGSLGEFLRDMAALQPPRVEDGEAFDLSDICPRCGSHNFKVVTMGRKMCLNCLVIRGPGAQ